MAESPPGGGRGNTAGAWREFVLVLVPAVREFEDVDEDEDEDEDE